jgi:hypothetical protein
MIFFPTAERRRQDLASEGRALLVLDGLGSHHTRVSLKTVQTRSVLKKFRISTPIENQGLNTSSTDWEKNLSMRVLTALHRQNHH